MFKHFFLLIIASLIYYSSCSQNKLTITNDNGTTEYQIVIPRNKTDAEWNAAFLLKKYIDKISGLSIPVVYDYEKVRNKEILVGNTSRSQNINTKNIAEDAVIIKSNDNKIYITGGKRKGILYSASTFLEEYVNVKIYTKDFEVLPIGRRIVVPSNINYSYPPPFIFRTTYFEDSEDRHYADWHKLNYFFEDRINFVHSFNQYLPDTYFKTHPEYFALVDGKRTPVQPCLSHPDVYKIMKSNLIKEMVKHPNLKVWSVSHTDDGTYCHCSLCGPKHTAGNGFIETLMPFVNRFAKDFPDKIISTLAYRQSIEPSKFTKPLSNVEIMLCYTHVNRALPIGTGPDNAKMFRDITNNWKKQTDNIFVWDYVINYLNTLSPFPNLQVLQPNIQYFRDNDIRYIFQQGSGNQKSEFNELKCYLISKLLWNPDINIQEIQNEFIEAFYGQAAPEIKEYILALKTEVKKNNAIVDIWADPTLNKNDFLSVQNILNYRNILNKALNKTKSNPTIYNRVLKEKLSIDYVELQIASQDINRKKTIGNNREYKNKIEDFITNTNRAKIEFLMNGERTPQDYRKLIDK